MRKSRSITVIHPEKGRITIENARDKLDAICQAAKAWHMQMSVLMRESSFEG